MGHTARSALAVFFIVVVGAAGAYFAQRPTVARGDAIAAQLVETSPLLDKMECDKEIPIRVKGATFDCKAFFKNGDTAEYTLQIDRAGHINVVNTGKTTTQPVIKKTSDPWGD